MNKFSLKFFDLSQDMLCIINSAGIIQEANQAWKTFLGWQPAEIINKHFADFIYKPDLEVSISNFQESLSRGFTTQFEFRALHKDGSHRWLSWNSKVDPDDKIQYGVARDITAKKEAEQNLQLAVSQLQSKELFLETTLSMIPSLVGYVDTHYRYQYVNQAFEAWFGLKREDCIGKAMTDIIGPEAFAIGKKYIDRALAGDRQSFQVLAPYHYGPPRMIQAQYIPDINNNKEVIGFFSVVHDITSLKNAELDACQKENELSTLFNNLTEAVLVYNSDGQPIKFNKYSLELLDLTEDQLFNRAAKNQFWVMVNEDLSILEPQNYPAMIALRTGEIIKNRVIGIYRPNGEIRWISMTALPIKNLKTKKSLQVIVTFNDISEQKSIKDQLIKKESDLRRIFDGLPVLIGQWDHQLINIHANHLFIKYFGKTAEEIKGHPISELFEAEDLIKHKNSLHEVLKGRVQILEQDLTLPDSTIRSVVFHYLPDFYRGYVVGFFAIMTDVTDEKNFETARRETEAKLIASSKMSALGEMAGGVAHEINNPLSIIFGKAGQIKRKLIDGKMDSEQLVVDLSKIESMADRISKIIKGLHSFSRNSDSDPMQMSRLSQIIDDTLELCKERFKNHSIDLKVECNPEIYIECRASQIAQVLMNLLSNAYDAIAELDKKWIHLIVTEHENVLKIKIEDSGKGIAEKIKDKIMQPFFTTKEVGKGTGLGLSISKGLIESHQGRLEYDAANNHTCFIIHLPKKQKKQDYKLHEAS